MLLICGTKNKQHKQHKQTQTHRNRDSSGDCQGQGMGAGKTGEMLVKEYKLPGRKWKSSGALTHSIVIIVKKTSL